MKRKEERITEKRFSRSFILLSVFILLQLLFVSCGSKNGKDMTNADASTGTKANATVTAPNIEFDSSNIALAFAAMSDVHIDTSYADGRNALKFNNALEYIKEVSENGINALFFAGDVTDRFSTASFQLVTFQSIIEQNFNVAAGEIEVIVGTGNHDSTNGIFANRMIEMLGDDYYRSDVDKDSMKKGNRHCIVNGYHFITVEPEHYGDMPSKYNGNALPARFSEETLVWLEKILSDITDNEPNKPIFLASHVMPYDTVYGSITPGWYTKNLLEVIANYPQIIVFSGHMHNQLNSERAIMQTSFTALDCGALKSLGGGNIIDQKFTKCVNFSSDDKQGFAQSLLVEVDKNDNVRIKRLDFSKGAEIGEAWVIPAPAKDKSHLKVYTKDRATLNSPPYFKDNASIRINTYSEGNKITVDFDAANGVDMIYYYVMEISSTDPADDSTTYYLTSKSFQFPKVEDMPDNYTVQIKAPSPGTYAIAIHAVDIWDKISNSIKADFIIK